MTKKTPDSPLLCRLPNYGLIRATGADAGTFLQGQFGNDVTCVDLGHHQLNCYSNPKGRLLAIFRLFLDADGFCLRIPLDLVEPTLQRLRMFVLMAKVKLEDLHTTHTVLGLCGTAARQHLLDVAGAAPQNLGASIHHNGVTILQVPGLVDSFEIYGEREPLDALYAELEKLCKPIDEAGWMYGQIQAGIPTIYPETREEFVAQMVNLQLIGGLSFKKGCYPGQEIVARMHYLGKLKRRMYLLQLDSDNAPAAGTDIYMSDSDSAVGKLVDARVLPGQPAMALAVLTIAAAEAAELRLGANDGGAITLKALPYPFNDEPATGEGLK